MAVSSAMQKLHLLMPLVIGTVHDHEDERTCDEKLEASIEVSDILGRVEQA